ncbi:MAG TPA: response regulator [Acidimicrobiales bacterium]|jgi:CheY-like chemotaxis protein
MTLSPTRPTPPPTVLVADDDDVIRGSVSEILRLEGYEVTEAGDGDKALNLLGHDHFDVLVLDNRLLRLDGMALLASVENPPPAVLMSGSELDPGGRKDLAVRGIAYLRKPVQPEHLLDAVATAMGRPRHP